jgi:hypothetical protein
MRGIYVASVKALCSGAIALAALLYAQPYAQAALPACTTYVSPGGGGDGSSPSSPTTFARAASLSSPGAVICMESGTYTFSKFKFTKNGTPSAWIVYRGYGDGPVNIVASTNTSCLWCFQSSSYWRAAYTDIIGLNFDGQNMAQTGIACQKTHHLRFVVNSIKNMGGAGISTNYCDYMYASGNRITHSGYVQGWSSAIDFLTTQWADSASGFHNIAINNIISGEYDASSHHTDGNGIIMDLSDGTTNYSSANTPSTLIANNVIYENGGRCICINTVSNIWVVNNTCYKNTLDTSHSFGEILFDRVKNTYVINNIVNGWNTAHQPFYAFDQPISALKFYSNLIYNSGRLNFTPSVPTQFIYDNPEFYSPPYVYPSAPGQYATALAPNLLGDDLELQAGSPAIDAGIDPTRVTPIVLTANGNTFNDSDILSDLQQYVFTDINGVQRPQGSGFDLGAYEFTQ